MKRRTAAFTDAEIDARVENENRFLNDVTPERSLRAYATNRPGACCTGVVRGRSGSSSTD